MGIRPAIIAVYCAANLSSCTLAAPLESELADTVFTSVEGPNCSVKMRFRSEKDYEGRLGTILNSIVNATKLDGKVVVSYIDFGSADFLTLTVPASCGGSSLARTARLAGAGKDTIVSEPFEPTVIKPPVGTHSLSNIVRSINGNSTTIEDCSLAINLPPLITADRDRLFHARLQIARDYYGLPILFVSQENNVLYLTFYKQCSQRFNMVKFLDMAMGVEPTVRVEMKSINKVSRDQLRMAYGKIL